MRKMKLWKRTAAAAGTLALAASLTLCAAGTAVFAEEEEEIVLTEEDDEGEEEEDWEEEELYDDWEEVEESPEDLELQDYLDANMATDLIELYGSLLYKQTMWNADGSETDATGFIYEDENVICARYTDKFEEVITESDYVGFDTDLQVPVRYVFDNEDTRSELVLNYEELVYLWGNEHVTGKTEKDGKVTFTTEMDDNELIGLILADFDGDILEGDILIRDTVFDAETKLMEDSLVRIVSDDGSSHDIFRCSLTVEPEEGYEENKELLDKLNGEDKHKLTLTLDPGTEDEQVITSEVGKGCAFSPVIYDGYSFFTDAECTKEATDEEIYDTENDVVLYAAFNEIYDEEMELDDADYELSFDDGEELDLSELFGDGEDTESVVG